MDFFQRQDRENCSVHAVNNAMGRVVVTPEEVADHVKRRVARFRAEMGPGRERDVKEYEESLSSSGTFFTAEAVWWTAMSLGRIRKPRRVGSLAGRRLVVLGVTHDGTHHAIGIRDGMIYDSLSDVPVTLNDENVSEVYSEVLGAYEL